jgi:predicted Ser/Thr protein kinase
MHAIAASLREQAARVRTGEALDIQLLEQLMSVLEEKMFGILKRVCQESSLLEIRAERDRQLAPFRAKMESEQVRQLEAQFEMRKLLELNGLPRLSLFYL